MVVAGTKFLTNRQKHLKVITKEFLFPVICCSMHIYWHVKSHINLGRGAQRKDVTVSDTRTLDLCGGVMTAIGERGRHILF